MKTQSTMHKQVLMISSLMAATAVFGQTICIWNGAGDGTNIDVSANYVGGVAPLFYSDGVAEFDGVAPGNLTLNCSSGIIYDPGLLWGIGIYLTGNQTYSVTIANLGANTNLNFPLNYITIDSGAGAFSLGNNSRRMNIAERPRGPVLRQPRR